MCTAATYKTDGFYFGRTLDYEFSYGDEIVVTPRRFPLAFSGGKALSEHFALLGMAHVADGYPLYYDAMNEKGLCMAGLNFVGNAAYAAPRGGEGDVAQFEFIPWVLAQCASVSEARVLLGKTNLTGTPFSAALPAAQLHWLLADKDECVTIESTADGLHVYDNPAGVLTNNPPFPQQLFRLNDYQSLSPRQPENTFAPALDLRSYSRGMGALGLPGDLSSSSRFVRAAYLNAHHAPKDTERGNVARVFRTLGGVAMVEGSAQMNDGANEFTVFTSAYSAREGRYYFNTYENATYATAAFADFDMDGTEVQQAH